jgi:rfaE bifunctional protein kinase chain/domain
MKSNQELIKQIKKFASGRVLVLGDLLLDEYIWGDVDRISPEAPVPVVNIREREFCPGGAANVAVTINSLGGKAILAGITGDDESGIIFKKTLDKNKISSAIIISEKDRVTPRKTRVIASNQQMLRIDDEDVIPVSPESRDELISLIIDELSNVDALLISDYAKGLISRELLSPVIDKAKSMNLMITVDPKPANINLFRGVTLISPNLKEAAIASGIEIKDRESLKKAAAIIIEKVSPKALLITRGSEGLSLFTSDGREHRLVAITSHVYDVSGAGDTMIGTLTLAMASGIDLFDSVKLANYAAAVVVRKPGVAPVWDNELIELIDSQINWDFDSKKK